MRHFWSHKDISVSFVPWKGDNSAVLENTVKGVILLSCCKSPVLSQSQPKGRIQEERFGRSSQNRKGQRMPQTWKDHRKTQQVLEQESNNSPLWPNGSVILGRRPLLSKCALRLASPWRKVKLSARQPPVRDLRDLRQLLLFLPCLVLSQMLLAPSPMLASGPTVLPSGWLRFGLPFQVLSIPVPKMAFWVRVFHFSSWKRHCQKVQRDMLWKEAAFRVPRAAWSQKKQRVLLLPHSGSVCLKWGPKGRQQSRLFCGREPKVPKINMLVSYH